MKMAKLTEGKKVRQGGDLLPKYCATINFIKILHQRKFRCRWMISFYSSTLASVPPKNITLAPSSGNYFTKLLHYPQHKAGAILGQLSPRNFQEKMSELENCNGKKSWRLENKFLQLTHKNFVQLKFSRENARRG